MTASYEKHDSPALRKARGAFFTPPPIARFISSWAIRHPSDRILEPSMGDAEFLVHAVERLQSLGRSSPEVFGSELHAWSAERGKQRVAERGGTALVDIGDFFAREDPCPFDAVIGNPPYIRFQDFSGEQRTAAQAAALRGGVALTGLASAWAAFTVHATLKLAVGGRLGFVLPAEILTANYAAPVRRFIFDNFGDVELVLFEEKVFGEADTETVLLLASSFGQGATKNAKIRQVRNAASLTSMPPATVWTPEDPADRWSGATVNAAASKVLMDSVPAGHFKVLKTWGETTLGIVTGKNSYFAISPEQEIDLALDPAETVPLSPPGSAHLRGLELSDLALAELGRLGKRTRLFRPTGDMSLGARNYIAAGESAGVHNAYKCRVRKTWWLVPLLEPADLLLTYMNADTVRLVSNTARVHHLNSVHGVYLREEVRSIGMELLPIASLNSVTMLSAEIAGRAYGGGVLKMEPGEADRWLVPSLKAVENSAERLRSIKPQIGGRLRGGKLDEAVKLVDDALLVDVLGFTRSEVHVVREARNELAGRRGNRGRSVKA